MKETRLPDRFVDKMFIVRTGAICWLRPGGGALQSGVVYGAQEVVLIQRHEAQGLQEPAGEPALSLAVQEEKPHQHCQLSQL